MHISVTCMKLMDQDIRQWKMSMPALCAYKYKTNKQFRDFKRPVLTSRNIVLAQKYTDWRNWWFKLSFESLTLQITGCLSNRLHAQSICMLSTDFDKIHLERLEELFSFYWVRLESGRRTAVVFLSSMPKKCTAVLCFDRLRIE